MQDDILLDINGLSIDYQVPRGALHAVNSVDLQLQKGEILGVAGESGCGKSTLAFAIMHLLRGTGEVTGGSIEFAGKNLVDLSGEGLRRFRWESASMVLQSAMNNLNPVITIREQLCDVMMEHTGMTSAQSVERAKELLRLVQIDEERLSAYPHQLSGGMRQRIVIAMALALEPDLVIMDEPTTGLDVVVQYMIMHQIADLSRSMGFAILIISHDLPLLLEVCDRLAIMYAGKIVEVGDREVMLSGAVHPYTHGLVNAFPPLTGPRQRQTGIPGSIPDLIDISSGCMFRDRCPKRMSVCDTRHPETTMLGGSHGVACYLAKESQQEAKNVE